MARWLEVQHKARSGPVSNKALGGPPENKGNPGDLAGVDFASDEAAELAASYGFNSKNFEGVEPSGVRGYTLADVRKLVDG